jgi:hypothetical protein
MIEESIECEVGDRIEVGKGLICLRQFAMDRNMTAEDLFDLINAGIADLYRQGRCMVTHDK